MPAIGAVIDSAPFPTRSMSQACDVEPPEQAALTGRRLWAYGERCPTEGSAERLLGELTERFIGGTMLKTRELTIGRNAGWRWGRITCSYCAVRIRFGRTVWYGDLTYCTANHRDLSRDSIWLSRASASR